MTEVAPLPRSSCSALTSGDFGLKALLCESADGSQGEVSFLPIVGWVTLTESLPNSGADRMTVRAGAAGSVCLLS